MKTDMKKWINNITNSCERVAFPIMTYPGLNLINKSVKEIISNPQDQFNCIKALSEIYPSAAAGTIMDLSLEAEAFGCPVRYCDDEVPIVEKNIITDIDDVRTLRVPEIGEGRSNVNLKVAGLLAESIKDRPVFGGCIGPLSLCSRLCDMTEMMMNILVEPEMVHLLLNKTTEFLIKYAKAFRETGANGIIIAEPTAGLLSPEQCDEFSSKYLKMIVESVQDKNFMVIVHNCGNTVKLVKSILSTGAYGFHFGNAVDMADILPQIPVGRIAFGNIDPATVLKNGTVAEVEDKVWELLVKTASYKNFVISSGCDIPPNTPVKNIDIFYSTLKRFNEKYLSEFSA
ncbi:MAG: uroporphyrinogen decarboxylase family protein [Clostridia bacterium]